MGSDEVRVLGTGLTVYEDEHAVEGPVRWLDSPGAVIEFVSSGDAAQTIVLARGGTTTFLTPALTSGVKGVMTLQGAPESHLGILSREYGIPCLMSVTFEQGITTERGETIPPDGTIVRLDVSTSPRGQVLVSTDAVLGDPAGDGAPPTPPDPQAAEQAAQIQLLLERFGGEVPHGSGGDREYRKRLSTGVLELSDETLERDLQRAEVNDLLTYMRWNLWDFLAARATEGESGLIPRQEYESVSCVQIWQRYPEIYRFITDEVGVDGLYEIGATSRHEIGSKANLLHIWCTGFPPAFGRGILMALGKLSASDGERDLRDILQFMRRLYRGAWGGGPMFTSMRDYSAPLLDGEWLERFREDCTPIDDPERRRLYQRFSATTELMGFLLHFDNRAGLADTGPYPTGDGGFAIVRDHFIHDPVYHWADVAEGLPHAITQAMFFKPDEELSLALMDGSTLFTEPANYLKHLTGMAVYARDRWDTPVSEIHRLDEREMARIEQTCHEASTRLYKRIASMSKRDKIWAGGQVYYTEFLLPVARRAGLWDRLVGEFDFFEIDPLAAETYYDLVRDGTAAELVPRLFLTGGGFPAVEDAAAGAAAPTGTSAST